MIPVAEKRRATREVEKGSAAKAEELTSRILTAKDVTRSV
jgi:hypothetical protein